jgi:hypothetical protein
MKRQAIWQVAWQLRQDIWKLSPDEAVRFYRETNDNEGFLVTLYPSHQRPIAEFIRFTPQEMEEVISCSTSL